MGLYEDIQNDISEALDGDLADVAKALTITKETTGVYNPVTGSAPIIPVISTMRCVVISDVTGEKLDEDSSTDEVVILVLDSDKKVSTFDLGDNASIDGSTYVIKGVIVDPAGATHTLKCRKF